MKKDKCSMKKDKCSMILFRRILFSIVSFASVFAAVYFSFFVGEPNYAMTGIWLTFSLFTFALGFPEIAESVTFLGNNIKLREVKNAINELKQLAEVNVSTLLEIIQTTNRVRGIPEDRQGELLAKTTDLLENLNFSEKEIIKIQSRWHYWVERDYINSLMNGHPEIPKDRLAEWQNKRTEIYAIIDDIQPNYLRKVFESFNCYTEKVKTAIEDWEHYKQHKKHKDIERWKKRNEWFMEQV